MNNLLIHDSKHRSRGFTLIEVIIALAIASLIMGGITTAIIQMINVNNQNTNLITAQRQAQQVGYAISQDALQARVITPGNNPAGTGFALVLSWVALNGDQYQITYRLDPGGTVYRDQKINSGAVTTTTVAKNIDTSAANTNFAQKQVGGVAQPGQYTLTVTATVPGKVTVSQTRTYEIKMRAVA